MGAIVDDLRQILTKAVQEHGLVAWFDPERHYQVALQQLQIPRCQILVYDGSFYALRSAAEPLIRGTEPPRLLFYLPVTYENAQFPLTELLALGETLRPGAIGQRNTKLAVIARRALKGRVAETRLTDLDRQVEKGQLTLKDLDLLAQEGSAEALPTVLAVLFGTPTPEEAALKFLADPNRDAELVSKHGSVDWAQILKTHYGVNAKPEQPLNEIRKALGRQVLTADLVETLGIETPAALKTVLTSKDTAIRRRCAQLAQDWRNRRDLAFSYQAAAAAVEQALHLDSIDFSDKALEKAVTFSSLERLLLRRVADRLAKGDSSALSIAESRKAGFWAEQEPDLQAEWLLIWQAATLVSHAEGIVSALKQPCTVQEIVAAYTREENSWSELDTLHRRLEKRASSLEFALSDPPAEIEHLVNHARHRYEWAAGQLAEKFLRAWKTAGFTLDGIYRQTQVFETFVEPLLREHRTAYFLVDALRFELARELPGMLGKEFKTQLDFVLGTAPSVTEVGMACLLPRAASGLRIDGTPKFLVSIHDKPLRNRQERLDYFKESLDVPVLDLKLEDLRNFKKKLKDLATGALIVVTSREIDQSGEDEMTTTREHMERVLGHLCLALRKLAENGVDRFVIATDHGYLYGADLAESEKIDPPNGKSALLHRRVWVGKGGDASPSYLYATLKDLGVASDLEIAVPWNLSGFRTPGPTAYFHGGLSPQEILLPVLVLTPTTWSAAYGAKKLHWELTLGTPRITTRFLSVRIHARAQGLFEIEWPRVRVELRAGAEVCSMPVSGTYGFNEAGGDVMLKASESNANATESNSVALMLTEKAPRSGIVSVHLLDATSGVELQKLEDVEVSLAI